VWDTLAHRQDHTPKDSNYENGSTAVLIKQQLEALDDVHTGRNM
jgi:hypothetical protein